MAEQANFSGLVAGMWPAQKTKKTTAKVRPNTEIMKNGYTRVPHELLEKVVSSNFSGRQHDLFWLVWRETEGRHRESFAASLRELALRLHADKAVVSRTVAWMTDESENRPLKRERHGQGKHKFTVNPDWIPSGEN